MKRCGLVVLAFGAALLAPATGNAAPPNQCATGSSGWYGDTVGAVTDTIRAGLIEDVPDLEAQLAAQDRNGDGMICLHILWGDRPNANANWWGVELFIVRDNHTNGR
jgi:hypothetical protein